MAIATVIPRRATAVVRTCVKASPTQRYTATAKVSIVSEGVLAKRRFNFEFRSAISACETGLSQRGDALLQVVILG